MCEYWAHGTTLTNTIFGAFLLAVARLQEILPGNDGLTAGAGEDGMARADPAAVECVLRHWTLGDSGELLSMAEWMNV